MDEQTRTRKPAMTRRAIRDLPDTDTRPSEAAMRAAKALMKKWTGIMLEAQHESEALAADDPFGPSLSDMQDGDDLAQDRIARIIDAHTREALDEVLLALKAWQSFDGEQRDNNPCPDYVLAGIHRARARELTANILDKHRRQAQP